MASEAPFCPPAHQAFGRSSASRPREVKGGLGAALVGVPLVVAAVGGVAAWLHATAILYALYVSASVLLGAICWTTLVWMLHVWRTPDSVGEGGFEGNDLQPAHSFSLIVAARHEEAVLEATLSRLLASDHPAFEVLVVVGLDDRATRAAADRVAKSHPGLVRVLVDASWPKSKPNALNLALPHCTGTVTGVFDAEDDVHPELLARVDQCLQATDADVVQAGVQLMNFRSSWWSVRNVLEYYFWFRSRLHFHARQRFIPLGGNTVFIRTPVLRAVSGWDADCLAEDCELGVRLSALGARTVVVYEPGLVTREECPPTLRAFARQRTRWNQGYLQTLSKGYWRRLPLRQRTLGAYTLMTPYLLGLAWLLIPAAIATAVALKAPILITLVSFLPALPMLSMLAVEVAALGDFCRTYGERASVRDYLRLVIGLPFYQAILAYAAARAVVREVRGERGWEKTTHLGLHLIHRPERAGQRSVGRLALRSGPDRPAAGGAAGRSPSLPMQRAIDGPPAPRPYPAERPPVLSLAGPAAVIAELRAAEPPGAVGNGNGHGHNRWPNRVTEGLLDHTGADPLWRRLRAVSANGSGVLALPGARPGALAGAPGDRLADAWARARAAVASRADVAVMLVLLAAVGAIQGTNMLHWPASLFDEGTYVGNAWAVAHGALAPYTYTYGHPPLAWLLIFVWSQVSAIVGSGGYSIDSGRELMLMVSLVSCSLLYTLARRIGMSRTFAALAVLLFALSPLSLFFHRAVLLDNPATAWALAAFVLALTPRRRLWAFAASGACFAASVLSKETTFVLLPALVLAAVQNADRRTRRYCLALFASLLVMVGILYPLYATLKGELLPGPGHVSLIGSFIVQLFTRQQTGSVFNVHSTTYATVTSWLAQDPWLLAAACVFTPIALARRSTRALALAFAIQVAMIVRPGYLPGMYVIGLLPFAALIVAGSSEALWHRWQRIAPLKARWSVALVIGALGFPVGLAAAAQWAHGDRVAITLRADGATRAAERWLVGHMSRAKRLIVDDEYWIYLIEHGFDAHPVRGGFYSRTVVSYWPLDYDPAVQRYFPQGWRDFDYIVSTEPIRDTAARTPQAALALVHSRLVVSFGHGTQRVEIRAITPTRRTG